jgi:Tol biopolymer transport system component
LQQITTEGHFNAFPMFSPDGKKIAWCSDRGTSQYALFVSFLTL